MMTPSLPAPGARFQLTPRDRDAWIDWNWVRDSTDEIWDSLLSHLILTGLSLLIGMIIALPLAVLASRHRRFYPPLLGFTGALYTIPSLALFALLIPYTGLSRTSALIPLTSYTLLILVRNTVAGLDAVPPSVREAAEGMGYSPFASLLRVELPLAVPTIVAGIRIATVTVIGLVTVTALIGQDNLGQLMLDGLSRDFRSPLTVGIVLSLALAVVADLVLAGVARLATPWRRDLR
ncbi:MAG: ABC transporter permease [Actinomycetota bacterium]|nr:ABC transporter permease [Actinomycetota bacterium]